MTTRRDFLVRSLALGCSAAASPFVTPIVFAATPGESRLVVIVLRGAMDGLDVVRPVGDPYFRSYRRSMTGKGLPLDGYFELHPAMKRAYPLWKHGELAFAHAVSTPYRDKRSHFDGQDMLETGTGRTEGDGWLNRAVAMLPGARSETAFAVGREPMLILSGRFPTGLWSPDANLEITAATEARLNKLYSDDPLFQTAARRAIHMSARTGHGVTTREAGQAKALAEFAAERLRGSTRIAAFSINGWDTHVGQSRMLSKAVGDLTDAILVLRKKLGPVWKNTTILCMTEFGRTVRENGSKGTDHGTGSVAIFAGGALRGAQVGGAWPGLAPDRLYAGRDLMPTRDVRAYAGWALRASFPLSKAQIEGRVFPGLDMGPNPEIVA